MLICTPGLGHLDRWDIQLSTLPVLSEAGVSKSFQHVSPNQSTPCHWKVPFRRKEPAEPLMQDALPVSCSSSFCEDPFCLAVRHFSNIGDTLQMFQDLLRQVELRLERFGDGSKPYPPVVHIKIAAIAWMFIPLKISKNGICIYIYIYIWYV